MAYHHRIIGLVLWIFFLSILPQAAYTQSRTIPGTIRMDSNGLARVIVTLNGDYGDEHVMPRNAIEARRARIAADQSTLIGRLGTRVIAQRTFVTLPALAVTVDAEGLLALQTDPLVAQISTDGLNRTTMAESRELIGARASNKAGFGGQGMVVAVLDTGVQHRDQQTGELRPHKMLRGRVSAEACFSSHDTMSGTYTSLCKDNQLTHTFAAGAAAPCADLCDHGTHVAATIAGNAVSIRDPYSKVMRIHAGVAPQAKIIAVQVFTKFTTEDMCGQFAAPCLRAWDSDIIGALEWLSINYGDRRFGGTLVAANMSLGGSSANRFCDDGETGVLYKNAIDALRRQHVATVIAAGNNGFVDSISSPGCVSSAITVGSTVTNTAPYGIPDRVSTFSNSPKAGNNFPNAVGDRPLDIYAPGDQVTSAIPTGSTTTTVTEAYATWSGTSMATPHVAGAWAVIRSVVPKASVTQVLTWLRNSGKPVVNRRTWITLPRINVDQAVTLAKNTISQHTLSHYAIEFGKVGRGQTRSRVITVRNNGTTAIPISIVISGAPFRFTKTCGNWLAGHTTCTITVRYTPTVNTHLAQQAGTLTVTLNRSKRTVGLTGTTTLYALSPEFHYFGRAAVNTNRSLPAVRLFNYSLTPITFATYASDGDGTVPFSLMDPYLQYPNWERSLNNLNIPIAPRSSVVVIQNLVFRPTYGRLPTSVGVPAGYYSCYPDASQPDYGSCVDRPALLYVIIDPTLTDGIDCTELPFDQSCRWLRFPFNGTADQ